MGASCGRFIQAYKHLRRTKIRASTHFGKRPEEMHFGTKGPSFYSNNCPKPSSEFCKSILNLESKVHFTQIPPLEGWGGGGLLNGGGLLLTSGGGCYCSLGRGGGIQRCKGLLKKLEELAYIFLTPPATYLRVEQNPRRKDFDGSSLIQHFDF